MVKWVCQIVTPVRHRALIFEVRLFAETAADDVLVTGGTFRFCRLVCLCVKRRNIIPNGKCRSLFDSTLFRTDNRTEQKTILPFSLALIFYIRFCRSFRTPFLPGGSLPAFRPRWYTHAFAVMAVTSLGDISRSDGHAIFKVQVRLQDHFSEKYSPLPYIQEVGKRAEKCKFPRLWTRPEKRQKFEGRTPLCSQNSPFRNGSKTCAWSAV